MKNKEDLLNLNNNNKNPKKILIYIAIFFLIFVIGVIVYAVIQGNSTSKNQSESVIPPQVKEEPLFKQIPIEKENNTSSIKTETNNSQSITNYKKDVNVTKVNESKNIEKVKQPIEIQTQNTKQTPKMTLTKALEKLKPKKPKTHIVSKKIESKYYIQVAALMKYTKPNKKFLELIKKYGYNYTFYTTVINRNGKKIVVHKILVGPFNSKKEAKKQLLRVKKYITQNAFIFKVNK